MTKEDAQTRKAKRQANGRSHAETLNAVQKLAQWAKALPEIDASEAFTPGAVTHMCFSHDAHCKTLNTGNGSDCNCSPDVSFHRQPQGS